MSDVFVPADDEECTEGSERRPNVGQFKPGTSGNPKGRPRKKTDERSMIEKAMLEPVEITVNDKKTSVVYMAALFMSLKQQALKGSVKAAQLLLKECPPHLLDMVDRSLAEQRRLDEEKRALVLEELDTETLMKLRAATIKVRQVYPERPIRSRRGK